MILIRRIRRGQNNAVLTRILAARAQLEGHCERITGVPLDKPTTKGMVPTKDIRNTPTFHFAVV
jgi:hypothetical protein